MCGMTIVLRLVVVTRVCRVVICGVVRVGLVLVLKFR